MDVSIKYEVRFTCYQYNGGGKIKNGSVWCKQVFDYQEYAQEFYEKLKEVMRNGDTRSWANDNHYVWDGYLSSIDGIYKITEEKII